MQWLCVCFVCWWDLGPHFLLLLGWWRSLLFFCLLLWKWQFWIEKSYIYEMWAALIWGSMGWLFNVHKAPKLYYSIFIWHGYFVVRIGECIQVTFRRSFKVLEQNRDLELIECFKRAIVLAGSWLSCQVPGCDVTLCCEVGHWRFCSWFFCLWRRWPECVLTLILGALWPAIRSVVWLKSGPSIAFNGFWPVLHGFHGKTGWAFYRVSCAERCLYAPSWPG